MQPKHTQSSANAKTGGRSVNTLHLTTMQFIHRGTTITKKKRGSVIQICFWFYFKKEVLHTLLTFFWQLQVYQAEKCPPIVPVFNCTRILAGSSVPPLFSSVLCSSRWDFSCGWPVQGDEGKEPLGCWTGFSQFGCTDVSRLSSKSLHP